MQIQLLILDESIDAKMFIGYYGLPRELLKLQDDKGNFNKEHIQHLLKITGTRTNIKYIKSEELGDEIYRYSNMKRPREVVVLEDDNGN